MNSKKIIELTKTFQKVLNECPELVFIGEPLLRQKTTEATQTEAKEIGERLKVTLKKYRTITGFGRGLAAPQIGINKSVFVTFIDDVFKVYANPKISEASQSSNFYRETCISCGILSLDVKRSQAIHLEFINENGEQEIIKADGFLARLLQHEYDHTQGIMNIDIAEPHSIEFLLNDPLQEKLREIK